MFDFLHDKQNLALSKLKSSYTKSSSLLAALNKLIKLGKYLFKKQCVIEVKSNIAKCAILKYPLKVFSFKSSSVATKLGIFLSENSSRTRYFLELTLVCRAKTLTFSPSENACVNEPLHQCNSDTSKIRSL